ncbi:cytochrome c oxidase subunit 3 [Alicyclobacillus tolerans]|uniref:cytochrome c oxidase subunit 3 n=1 Tax=Alicyclobacillus tolerans TaxID=90970 RepID=UPI001F01D8B8|nr:cytochrome c oxidase subunit 3 [Alicyclobacillus tolerans]MCF8565339.1 cytochrome c oxidase subunit 3 [Alicyclobacillus tolerans]
MSVNQSAAKATMPEAPEKITAADHRKLRGGLTLVLLSAMMPFLVMIDVRYLLTDGYVSPEANQAIGLISAILMLLSGIWIGGAVRAGQKGNLLSFLRHLATTFVLGAASLVLTGVQLFNHSVDIVSHYGETFVTTLGLMDVYILVGLISLLALRMRVKRLGTSMDHSWGMKGNMIAWRFIVVACLVMYVQLYLL